MGKVSKSENVPKPMMDKYRAIVELTNGFSDKHLNVGNNIKNSILLTSA